MVIFFFAGCTSTRNISLNEKSPCAVITITGTSLVSWFSDESDSKESYSDGALSKIVNQFINGKDPEISGAVDRLDYADESFRRILPEYASLEILDKNSVLESEMYNYAKKSIFNSLSDSTNATGYKDMSVIGAKKARMLEDSLGARSLAVMNFSFKKTLASGTRSAGRVAALVALKMKILDENGHEFINKEYERESEKSIPIINGNYKKEELLSLINETIDDLITQFAVVFSGNLNGNLATGSGFEADGKNVENAGVATETNQKDNNSSTSGDEYVPAVSAKLGKPKLNAKNALPENSLDGAAADATPASPSEKDALELQAENTARSLLKMGLDCEKISVATGLSLERVEELQNEIQKETKSDKTEE